jgi:hypothetical protein
VPVSATQAGPSFFRIVLLSGGIFAGVVLLGLGGCASILFIIYQSSESVAGMGADYLRNSPEIQKVAGSPLNARRKWTGWNVKIQNKTGNAFFTYDVDGPGAKGYGEVTLIRTGGTWRVVGGRFSSASSPNGDILLGGLRKLE